MASSMQFRSTHVSAQSRALAARPAVLGRAGGVRVRASAQVSTDAAVLALEDREHFRSVLAEAATAGDLLVVDYFTTWCGPCKLIAPKVEEMAAELAGQGVRFGKVTCDASDDNKRWAQAVKIKTLPTFRIYKAGDEGEVAEMCGTKMDDLRTLIKKHSA